MNLVYYFKNLFTGFRSYSFMQKRLRARPQQQNNLSQNKTVVKKKFMSKHRYTHTSHKWNIGKPYKK